jgi:hypothetical protein
MTNADTIGHRRAEKRPKPAIQQAVTENRARLVRLFPGVVSTVVPRPFQGAGGHGDRRSGGYQFYKNLTVTDGEHRGSELSFRGADPCRLGAR